MLNLALNDNDLNIQAKFEQLPHLEKNLLIIMRKTFLERPTILTNYHNLDIRGLGFELDEIAFQEKMLNGGKEEFKQRTQICRDFGWLLEKLNFSISEILSLEDKDYGIYQSPPMQVTPVIGTRNLFKKTWLL